MITRHYNTDEDRNLLGVSSYFLPFIRSSRSVASNEKDAASVSLQSVRTDNHELPRPSATGWVPYTFSHYYMSVLSLVTFSLCLITFLLWWRSATNYGLGPDNGSSAMLFGWRYSPTMIAVIYVQMTAVLFEDVKRTEPYARLARPEGADASSSILKTPGAWWNALHDGFGRKKNGRRSWILICASLVNIFGFLAISPLSSAYLFSEEVVVPTTTDFRSLAPAPGSALPINADRTTNFRTIANLLQNVSTSPWITDRYTILPFWPASLNDDPITSLPSTSSQKWRAKTTMFRSELSCSRMSVESQSNFPGKLSSSDYFTQANTSIVWSSADGCKYGLSVSNDFFDMGGGSWSDASTFYYGRLALVNGLGGGISPFTMNNTAECENKEILIVTDSWNKTSAKYEAQLCDTRYYMANISTTLGLTGDDPDISFDENEYERNKVAIPDSLVNTTQFRNLTLDENWPTYMISIIWSQMATLGGPSILLGAMYDYNMTSLVNDRNWVASAAKAKQRYFGEVLQAALTHSGASQRATMQGQVHKVEDRVVVQASAAIALGVLFAASFFFLLIVWWLAQLQRRPLNLNEDPASAIGVACLMAYNARTKSGFSAFRQPSSKDLNETLGGVRFCTDSHGLSRINPEDTVNRNSTQSENGTPKLLRLPALVGLTAVLVAVVTGIAVLWHFADTTGLYEKAFVYQVRLSWLSDGVSSVAPFSMIPTVIATGIGLWWSAIDDNFRRLTPFLVMSKGNPRLSHGANLSYQSSFWLWACVKAAMNKHWLLSLLTLGTTLSPVFTTAMSALFDRGPGIVTQSVTLNNSFEVRNIPFVFPTKQAIYPDSLNDYSGTVLADLYTNLSAHWMYTATIQLALNGSEPAWSKDGWSFVPVGMHSIQNAKLPHNLDDSDKAAGGAKTNVSLTTPALRGRIECTEWPAQTLMNTSIWLTEHDLTNSTVWNRSTIPEGLHGGYQLGAIYRQFPSAILPIAPSQDISTCPNCTTIFANPSQIICCKNGSSSDWHPSVAIGFWSPNTNPSSWSTRDWHQNFTAKWFTGNAVTDIKKNGEDHTDDIDLLFTAPPSTTMLNCRPLVESAQADITVNPTSGEIQSFNITSSPKELTEPFADNFLPHNETVYSRGTGYVYYNVTLSFGRLFMSSMLTAADTLHISGASHVGGYNHEDLNDNTYNIRDEINGLNMDFMSYAMYSMADKDASKLLDTKTYTKLAERTFTTFFQHFVSNNVSDSGGWGYQQINASLPADLGPILELASNNYLPGTKAASHQDDMHPISHTNRTVVGQVSQRVELLQMNATAVWLSIGIMGWLIMTTTIVAILQRWYFGSLVRNVECLGDVLVLIAGSANFLQVVRDIQAGRLSPADFESLRTRLGWFVDEDGGLRWGIEMEESFRDGPGVHWVAAPHFSSEKGGGTNTWNISDDNRHV